MSDDRDVLFLNATIRDLQAEREELRAVLKEAGVQFQRLVSERESSVAYELAVLVRRVLLEPKKVYDPAWIERARDAVARLYDLDRLS